MRCSRHRCYATITSVIPDARLQDAGGCDGASTESGSLPVGNLGQGVACADDATGSGYLMYSEVNTHER